MTQQGEKPIILIICDYYLPGFESGGAMRTLVNMVERLGGDFEFRIITRDHDGPLDKTSYKTMQINAWNRVGNADVYYLSRDRVRPGRLRQLVQQISPDSIYLNSFFSPLTISVLMLRKLRRITSVPIVLAPEGEFSPGALSLKSLKKQLYVTSAKSLRMLQNIVWKAASESEVADIEMILGKTDKIFIAPNMPPDMKLETYNQADKPEKTPGSVRMVFLSRFMRKKNFNWLLGHLREVKGGLKIDICGPLEDADYWQETRQIIKKLPTNVNIEAKGPVPHDQVSATLARYHFFIMPTIGENFGHVFIEAFAAGCPVITSDLTPWRNLHEKGVGWDLPLEDPAEWVEVINKCIEMDDEEYREMSRQSRKFAVDWLSDPSIETSNRKVLLAAIGDNCEQI